MGSSTGPRRTIKVQLMMSAAELRAVDDWRFAARMGSRAHAIRTLLRRALAEAATEIAAAPSVEPPADADRG